MAVRNILGCLILAAGMVVECSKETVTGANGGLDGKGSSTMNNMTTTGGSPGGTTTATGPAACTAAASWKANNDLKFDDSSGSTFAQTMNALIGNSTVSPMAVSNTIAPHCVWMVAFSAVDDVGASAKDQHAATFTEMFHHTTGLWTVAPQTSGWLRVVDASDNSVWVPLSDLTASATYRSGEGALLLTPQAPAT